MSGGGCGGVRADPPNTEAGEGGSGVDPAGKHGAGAEAPPRVRVGRSSREVEAEELEGGGMGLDVGGGGSERILWAWGGRSR